MKKKISFTDKEKRFSPKLKIKVSPEKNTVAHIKKFHCFPRELIYLPKVSPWKKTGLDKTENSFSRFFFFFFLVNQVNKMFFSFRSKSFFFFFFFCRNIFSQSASHTGNMFLWVIFIWHENLKKNKILLKKKKNSSIFTSTLVTNTGGRTI